MDPFFGNSHYKQEKMAQDIIYLLVIAIIFVEVLRWLHEKCFDLWPIFILYFVSYSYFLLCKNGSLILFSGKST
jgi:hypothetical protein